ncbi:class I SAM-dependent methyltransferase [Halostagnicola kamekurae]|uniref:Methyltransferase domain-containing protein n=1 Tax=Halostagnicola kamekurae TaxID=619731 RepID=A0A1I6QN71_9EURY|nr:class I SAM-dependent methyltransferase [Halostagnicola kamekurae]SFS53768.1 Methyltransferase domain-containing protein [Halostagnicola kamekurae]
MTDYNNSQKDVADFYEEEASTYDERFESIAGEYIHNRQVSIILEQLGDISGDTVLEIAAGTGRFTHVLAAQDAKVIVIDIAREMLEENRQRTPEAEFVHGTASELPFEPSSIDHCVTVNALNHIPGHWDVVADVKRVLKPGGKFLANYPNILSNRFPIGMYVNNQNRNVGKGVYTKWFNIFEVKRTLKSMGYNIEACIGDRFLPVKILPKITVPASRMTEEISGNPIMSNICVSPFVLARKE